MKNFLLRFWSGIAIAVLVVAIPITHGCKSAEKVAYQATSTAQITVDAAMTAWGDWVGQGKATVDQERAVKSAYLKYQAAAVTVIDAAKSVSGSPTNAPAFNLAVTAASAALGDLVNLLKQFGVKL